MKFPAVPLLAFLSLVASTLLTGCSQEESVSQAGPVEISLGDKSLTIEFAITQSEQRMGLMGREGIADNHGMLFVYQEPQRMSYWMKNVDFPIDIGFFTADGVLREVYPMYPRDTLARKSIREDMLYALETRHRWYSENNIRPGAQIDLKAVRAALSKR
ncbi:DUF192 domain-containing protein [Pelagicoccus sp. SDUM812002]|uniref:DUF192 domain-containing protein n=1 Tax=Pelagicoccus sp. SDUM812002 TaxID=3041266 RepID=UPI00280EA446|nr:DUF192 domain-containing protein [Pelagicoccus sp. SDUM812002]MDQ8185504.1 DUF192 domain-containing protein [Pelagicoccus sp. SDUM812002]